MKIFHSTPPGRQPLFWRALYALQSLAESATRDKISLYAAQASFFVIISAVPFLSLLISITGLFIPTNARELFEEIELPEALVPLLGAVVTDLQQAPSVSILSISAITTLWSASRGMAAIRGGLENVYRQSTPRGYIRQRAASLLGTLLAMIGIVAVIALLLFGDALASQIQAMQFLLPLRFPIAFVLMCAVFTILYASSAARTSVGAAIRAQLPGAVLSAVGWIVFSFGYSLYIAIFPRASYIYGSLAAVCLILLWLYVCMTILLLGAEVNKSLEQRR